jgi:hypothetical protein
MQNLIDLLVDGAKCKEAELHRLNRPPFSLADMGYIDKVKSQLDSILEATEVLRRAK